MSQEIKNEAEKLGPTKDFLPSGGATCSGFFIVNDHDRPSEHHLAERRADGKFYYVHPDLWDVKAFHGMTPTSPTPVKEFGITVEIRHGLLRGDNEFDSRATYRDGRPRRWQGARRFSFSFPNAELTHPESKS